MTPNEKELTERYIYQVVRRLPKNQRDEVGMELYELIGDMYEEQPDIEKVLEKLGVNRVVIPEQENAQRLGRSLHSHNVLEYIELSEEYGILEVPAPKGWTGKSIRDLNIRAKLGINIIAVESGRKTNVSPSADYTIQPDDILVVLGDSYSLEELQKL